jgi:EmrB/QacA subfamily drug resistance transporter
MTTTATAISPAAATIPEQGRRPRQAAASRPATAPGRGTLLVLLTAVFMSTLDFFIVNVAVPSVQSDLHASAGQIQWTIAGFALAVGAGVITAGRLGDLFGRRRMFSLGLGLFTLTSAACGLVPNAGELVGSRVAQGLSAALMTPQVLAIIGTAFTGKALGRAFTAYGLTMGLAAVFGQLIGGALIQADLLGLGWRGCFLINVPIGITALALTRRYVPSTRGTGRARLDLVGATLVTAALIATVLPLIDGREQGWPLWTTVSFAAAAVLYAGFGLHQRWLARRGGVPLIDLRMFTDRAFSAGMLVQLIAWTGQGSFFLVLAIYLQQGLGLTALTSGVVFVSIGGGYIATSVASGAVTARLGRQTVALGAALMMVALVLLIAASAHIGRTGSPWWLVPGLAVDGAGMGLIIAPLASIVLARVAPHHAGAASGVLSTVMQVGGAMGIAVIGIVFYDGLGDGGATAVPHAFRSGLEVLIAVAAGVAVAIQLVPDVEPASTDAR